MTDELKKMIDDFFAVQCRYEAAIRQVKAKLENLDAEFQMQSPAQSHPSHADPA